MLTLLSSLSDRFLSLHNNLVPRFKVLVRTRFTLFYGGGVYTQDNAHTPCAQQQLADKATPPRVSAQRNPRMKYTASTPTGGRDLNERLKQHTRCIARTPTDREGLRVAIRADSYN